ncbi:MULTISPECIES: undecaprenyldiphospho-muramoylpentapeptide beta-N-acetylglucosaminyltransferase [Bacillaceae]|uniref:undecaprenyldiphospho-muramoylpentapeptide beta-N-acetylglucosaminyltransferase n=1 Tax=Bacillaceae TaxID=186817 RepID=UPI0006F490F0|nr:undecaprenyldiphospho-muramoylpentapeptide beta-N-acetylglucosaminyltransferase [Bacillus sp. FJAT-25509]KQL39525.1 UDP-diphospho-muramoylpentapeptide beta-N-acetylglucosaminyltransferase [Bacillus sp. FJAT-25509]
MKILVSGGGTGGHIYPALALIKELKKQDSNVECLYVGTENGLEKGIVSKANIPFKSIVITGFKRSISLENFKTVYRFLKGVSDSKKIIREFKPDVVVGTGGYVCGPVVYAAAKLGIPTVIHEQNSIPGLTNKFLNRYVTKVAICFEEVAEYFNKEKVVFTGNPRASEVLGESNPAVLESLGLKSGKRTVLIVGGSRGARPIHQAFLKSVNQLGEKDYQMIYVTGEVHYDSVIEEINKVGNPENVVVKPFLHNMPEVLREVDLVVSRAGATTLAELTALGKPSILIPSPYVTNNHQEVNARSLEKNGAAIVILEKNFNSEYLVTEIEKVLLNPIKLEEMKNASLKIGVPDAAKKLVNVLEKISK